MTKAGRFSEFFGSEPAFCFGGLAGEYRTEFADVSSCAWYAGTMSAAGGPAFADVAAVSPYAARAVREVAVLGWMDGVGRFDSAGVMTCEQAATVAARVLETRR